ncbi:MAG: sulfurtransferase-like selenium metabolism protein YedF [Proteobacteria bacterium]|nr:sulfurtransferase-like selenium metabolism protein YedF [Pseudomonadota bacterium]
MKKIISTTSAQGADQYMALSRRYLEIPCACMTPNDRRLGHLDRMIERFQPDVVVDVRMKEIDCRGMACPEPVLTVKKAIEQCAESLSVIVDDAAAKENVRRFAESQGYGVDIKEEASGQWRLNLTCASCAPMPSGKQAPAAGEEKIVIYIARKEMGAGDEELGLTLMRAFLKTLLEFKPLPWRMIFLNGGVKLTTSGSPVLGVLEELEQAGVEVLSCGTCLDYFQLKSELKAGKVTNMFEIVASLRSAGRVIAP